jgi:hypothetical protein
MHETILKSLDYSALRYIFRDIFGYHELVALIRAIFINELLISGFLPHELAISGC